jgi:hypothetical protein
MADLKLASLLKAFSDQLARLEADPSSVYLDTQCEADGDYSCLQYSVAGVQVLRLAVRKEVAGRGEDVSFCLSDSPGLSSGSDTQSSIGIEAENANKNRQIYSRSHASPFLHKPDFQRRSMNKRTWKRALTVEIPEDPALQQTMTPAWEDIARYPRPSTGLWEQGTKQAHEDVYYYGDLEG